MCPHWISLNYLEKAIYRCSICGEQLPHKYLEKAKEQTKELNKLIKTSK